MSRGVLHRCFLTATLSPVVTEIRDGGSHPSDNTNHATEADQPPRNGHRQIEWAGQVRWQVASVWQDKGVAAGAWGVPLARELKRD